MVRQIIWSLQAKEDKKEILEYWINRNKSNHYSKKLNQLFIEAIQLISKYPKIGKPTSDKSARIKMVRDYLIIYEVSETYIQILTIWDGRQDPQKLEKVLK